MIITAEKRYFWLKLYDDFFTSKRIKKLRSIAGGDTYTIIYLKMQLKALKTEGYLYFDGVMSDFAEELALDLDENADDVRVTIQFLLGVGLLETNNEDAYKLTYMDKLIGSENASAQRVRDHRAKQKALHCNTDVTEVKRSCNAEIDIEIELEKDKEHIPAPKEPKHSFGEYGHVKLKDSEYAKLIEKYGKGKADEYIQFLDEYIERKGYKAKSHYLCIGNWVVDAVAERERKKKPEGKYGSMMQNDINFDELEKKLLT